MTFEHGSYNLAEIDGMRIDGNHRQLFIYLDDENTTSINESIVAQAISLDIRGNYGFFLNNQQNKMYQWTGNLFHITVEPSKDKVLIEEIEYNEDGQSPVYDVSFQDWEEALKDWRKFYLTEMGFMPFRDEANLSDVDALELPNDEYMQINHVFGVLLLTYDQIPDQESKNNQNDYDKDLVKEMTIEAIKKCATRYGVEESVIRRHCKKVTGFYSIQNFYEWVYLILLYPNNSSKWSKYSSLRGVFDNDKIGSYSDYLLMFVGNNINNCNRHKVTAGEFYDKCIEYFGDK